MSADPVARGLAKQAASTSALASIVAGQGSALLGFRPAAPAASGRSVQDKLRERVSVLDFGAKGDGVTDDTAAIQSAINATLSINGGTLFFPDGVYKITTKLVIPFATGWRIEGQSRSGTIIRQFTANTRIFSLESDLTHSWEISELWFTWSTAQPATNTQAIAVFMGTGVATGNGMFNATVRRCRFDSGFRGVATDVANSPPVWGFTVRDFVYQGTGAAVYFNPNPAIGQPRITVERGTIDCAAMAETAVVVNQGDTLALKGLEFLGGNAPNKLISCTQGTIKVEDCRSENYNAGAASVHALFEFLQAQVTILNCGISGTTGSGGNLRFVAAGTTSQLTVSGLNCSDAMTAGTPIAYVGDNIVSVANVKLFNRWSDNIRANLGPTLPVPRFNADKRQIDAVTEVGDASVALTAASDRFQSVSVALTVARTITLPSTGVYDGMEFEIVRRLNGVSGAFALTVSDPLSAQNFVFPASSKGFARYRAIGTGAWRLVACGLASTDTGWTAGTGTALKGAFAAYAGATHTAAYVQATIQALDNAARDASQRVKALEDACRAGGVISA